MSAPEQSLENRRRFAVDGRLFAILMAENAVTVLPERFFDDSLVNTLEELPERLWRIMPLYMGLRRMR